MKPNIILASKSPRRKELLNMLGFDAIVVPAEKEETSAETNPRLLCLDLARAKAEEVAKKHPEDIVIGADTIVSIDDKILGKPKNRDEALSMLTLLSGKEHRVYTGVSILYKGMESVFAEMTEVKMFENPRDTLISYIETGEPMDKAGAYGIQGKGALLVEGIKGDFYNVVGLPVAKVAQTIFAILSQHEMEL